MVISGRFLKASDTTYRDGKVVVGFIGSAYPQTLTTEQIQYIKDFYNMHGSKHEVCQEFPDDIEPMCSAMKNLKNGFLILTEDDADV